MYSVSAKAASFSSFERKFLVSAIAVDALLPLLLSPLSDFD